MKIIDNFLEQEKFDEIQRTLNPMVGFTNPSSPSQKFSWFFRYKYYAEPSRRKKSLYDEDELDQFQFTHTFYEEGSAQSPYFDKLQCFLELLQPVAVWRIRGNLLTRLPNIVINPFHTDISFLSEERLKQWTTSIFYVNTNNGYTVFEDGTKVESVANRMLTFPANMKHTGTSCTDEKIRVVINFNYFSSI